MIGGGEQAPLIEAPAVASICQKCIERPHYLSREALTVDPGLWQQGFAELRDILNARGWPMAADQRLSEKGVAHFMLCGVPIVMGD